MSKYIKTMFILFLFGVFLSVPQEASAKTVYIPAFGYSMNIDEVPYDNDMRALMTEYGIPANSSYRALAVIEDGITGTKWLLLNYGGGQSCDWSCYGGRNNVLVKAGYSYVWIWNNGKWEHVATYPYKSKSYEVAVNWSSSTSIYVVRDMMAGWLYVGNTEVWKPTDPTPTPLPTPTPTPTPDPVANIDIENTGITDLFAGALRIFNVPLKVESIEFTWWQIFIYLILAGLVIDLIFAPSDK